ncbi:MAG: flagellar biosynthetic protein FliQ [Rickettsiales endosymbiont of Dermacentor nuttalli]
MDTNLLLDISKEAMYVLLKVSLPVLLIPLIVGLIVSLFQALTQIQENALAFVPKIIAVALSLIIFMPYILENLQTLVLHINQLIITTN